MKKLFFVISVLFISTFVFAQSNHQLLELKTDFNLNFEATQPPLPVQNFEKKSPGLAILYSLLLPGMGELYAGNYSTGKYFTIADGVIWGFFTGMTIYGNNKEDDYRSFAKAYGSVNLDGKDEEYFANISLYENIDEFNREKELNRDFNGVYDVDTYYWEWEGTSQRREYRDLWLSSENAKNNVRFAVGALVLNRIVSAIFAVRSVSAYNKKQAGELSWNVNFGFEQKPTLPTSLVMNFSHRF